MTHRNVANNFSVGFKHVGGQRRPHINRRDEVLSKDSTIIGPIKCRVDKENTLVPGELAHVTDVCIDSHELGIGYQ